ncbi:MAG TPA: cupin domain-containing protein, partial [Candidatus Acidoferrum sp.]|nr:cupin domain-containing protein [Candidatus Acidoferrum sp.]
MSYDRWTEGVRLLPEARATVVGPTDAEQVHTSPVSLVTFVAKGELTGGRFGLFRYDMLPGRGGPGPHLHTTFSESFYVMSGVLTVHDGKGWVQAGAGSFLHVPERSVHGFRNDSDDPASFLVLFAPAPPREQFFREIAEINAAGRKL